MVEMPRNASTGKVQKALVQAILEQDHQAEVAAKEELRLTQRAQLAWYADIIRPMVIPCALQPMIALELYQVVRNASDVPPLVLTLTLAQTFLKFGFEAALRLSLTAWTYGASAHAASLICNNGLSLMDPGMPLIVAAVAGAVSTGASVTRVAAGLGVAGVLVSAVAGLGVFDKRAKDGKISEESKFAQVRGKVGRVGSAVIIGVMPRLLPYLSGSATTYYGFGLLTIFALNRRLPGHLRPGGSVSASLQRLAATAWGFLEAPGYMLSLAVTFSLALPGLIIKDYCNFAWGSKKFRQGKSLGQQQSAWPFAGPHKQLNNVKCEEGPPIWADVNSNQYYETQAPMEVEVRAQTPAGSKAQTLARQAGVDFHSMDSLRVARLSVMLKKHLRPKPQEEPLEFAELREACTNEQTFVDLIDSRLVAPDEEGPATTTTANKKSSSEALMSWVRGGAQIHREGPTPVPWDCRWTF
jgi:hypothetical protein